jgi:hypothetical protein
MSMPRLIYPNYPMHDLAHDQNDIALNVAIIAEE